MQDVSRLTVRRMGLLLHRRWWPRALAVVLGLALAVCRPGVAAAPKDCYVEIEAARALRLSLVEAMSAERDRQQFLIAARRGSHGLLDLPLSHPSGLSGTDVERLVSETPLAGFGAAFAEAEQSYSVNALALLAIAALESAWGTSSLARERNNLFGYMAFTEVPGAAKWFDSWDDSIAAAARTLRSRYLDTGGQYYRGGTLRAIGLFWATDTEWAAKVASIVALLAIRADI